MSSETAGRPPARPVADGLADTLDDWFHQGRPSRSAGEVGKKGAASVGPAGAGWAGAELARLERSWMATAALVAVLLLVWVASGSSVLVAVARFFWPEQALALGIAGWLAWGPGVGVLFLVALGGTPDCC